MAPSGASAGRKGHESVGNVASGPSVPSDPVHHVQSQSHVNTMGHRRSRSTFDPKYSYNTAASYSTPDMVPNVEHLMTNVVSV